MCALPLAYVAREQLDHEASLDLGQVAAKQLSDEAPRQQRRGCLPWLAGHGSPVRGGFEHVDGPRKRWWRSIETDLRQALGKLIDTAQGLESKIIEIRLSES
jgi:hypothetical protein